MSNPIKQIKLNKKKVKITRYKNGGYVREEKIDDGIIGFQMNGKGFYEMFAKPLMNKK